MAEDHMEQAPMSSKDTEMMKTPSEVEKSPKVPIVDIEQLIPGINIKGLNDVKQLIAKVETGERKEERPKESIDSNYMMSFIPILERYSKLYPSNPFNGKVLVDLGAGSVPNGYLAAKLLGASGYIAVEPYNYRELYERLSSENGGLVEDDEVAIPANVAPEDMLEFLRRLPDQSVNILTSGLDITILPDYHKRKEIEKEIERVLLPDGAYLSESSLLNPKKLKRELVEVPHFVRPTPDIVEIYLNPVKTG